MEPACIHKNKVYSFVFTVQAGFSVVCLRHTILFRFFCSCVRICFYFVVNIFCVIFLKEEYMFWVSDFVMLAKEFGTCTLSNESKIQTTIL